MSVDKALLDILCCPAIHGGDACHGDLIETEGTLQCTACGLHYPIEGGIPVLLAGRAKKSASPDKGAGIVATLFNNGGDK
jgi:uncharacterized protein YbaR (Trm112 family)